MIEVKDEILESEPSYRILDKNGNILFDEITIEMITKVLQAGTPLNKALFDIAMPSGLICMWSGSVIPTGWYLCDGTNGTPDLRDKFIVGSGNSYTIGATGGSDTVTLTTAQMPAHTHTGTTASVTVTKSYSTVSTSPTSSGKEKYPCLGASGTGSGYDGSYPIDMGTHSHSFTTNSTGSGQAHENRPPYYALAFIMKA